MPEHRVTIADVARAAGVSQTAVSFALNGRPGLADATRAHILRVAEEIGWRPNASARSLSTRRALALGLVFNRPPELFGADPFFPSFIGGVETVLAPAGQSLVLHVVRDDAGETRAYRRLAQEGVVDGVFVTDLRRDDPRLPLLEDLGLPAVTLNRPESASPFPAVCLDDRPGITAAVGHLAGLGHRRIAHVGGPGAFLHGANRRAAWADALTAHGLRPDLYAEADFTAAGGAAATAGLLDLAERPTAIVYANDVMAVAGLSLAVQRGLRVPEDLSLTGFDDTEIAAHLHPALTTVRTDVFGWGRAAARSLLALVAGSTVEDVVLPPAELVIRQSTHPLPAPPGRRAGPADGTGRPHADDARSETP